MDQHQFTRLCVPPLSVLVVAGAWLLNHLGFRLRTVSGQLTDNGRALSLVCKGMRSEKERVFLLPFYIGKQAIASRIYLMSVLEQTGKHARYQLNGRAARGMREHAYFGPTDRCQLLWSRKMVTNSLSQGSYGWSPAKITEMALHYPEAPTLIIDSSHFSLPTEPQCDAILNALQHHNGAIHPRERNTLHDGLEASGLQVICNFEDIGVAQLSVDRLPAPNPLPDSHFETSADT